MDEATKQRIGGAMYYGYARYEDGTCICHCYGCKLRPPSIGCYPVKDGCKVIMYDGLFFDPDFGMSVWGRVYYEEPLSDAEIMGYELVDRDHKVGIDGA